MAIGDGTTWDEFEPTNNTLATQIDEYNRDIRVGIRGRMAHEHEFPASQSATSEAGKHKFLTFQMQGAAPSIGGTQVGALYITSSGAGSYLMHVNTATQEINISKKLYFWYMDGAATTGEDISATLELVSAGRINAAKAWCSTTASGSVLQFDILYNDVSIWTDTSDQVILAAGSTSTAVTSFASTNVAEGGTLKLDVDKIGSGIAGGGITVMVEVG